MTFLKISTAAAVLGLVTAIALPVNAAPNKDDCIAKFTKMSPKGDMALSSETGKKYTEVAQDVDVNKDGMISKDEYTVGCTKDLFKEIEKDG